MPPLQRAREGIGGASSGLPHQTLIQSSFGRHDVGSIRAHTGSDASAACNGLRANAYAVGNDVAFGSAPDLRTAAHEATHSVLQRAGVAPTAGVGERGDAYEQHADSVADLVVQGKNVEGDLSDLMASGTGFGAASTAVQMDFWDDAGDWLSGNDSEEASTDTASHLVEDESAQIDDSGEHAAPDSGNDSEESSWLEDKWNDAGDWCDEKKQQASDFWNGGGEEQEGEEREPEQRETGGGRPNDVEEGQTKAGPLGDFWEWLSPPTPERAEEMIPDAVPNPGPDGELEEKPPAPLLPSTDGKSYEQLVADFHKYNMGIPTKRRFAAEIKNRVMSRYAGLMDSVQKSRAMLEAVGPEYGEHAVTPLWKKSRTVRYELKQAVEPLANGGQSANAIVRDCERAWGGLSAQGLSVVQLVNQSNIQTAQARADRQATADEADLDKKIKSYESGLGGVVSNLNSGIANFTAAIDAREKEDDGGTSVRYYNSLGGRSINNAKSSLQGLRTRIRGDAQVMAKVAETSLESKVSSVADRALAAVGVAANAGAVNGSLTAKSVREIANGFWG
jgi:hypothetical protein